MTEYVRVKQAETGHELSVPRAHLDAVPDGAYTVLDKDATGAGGEPLPPKYKTSVATKAAESKKPSGQQATTGNKE